MFEGRIIVMEEDGGVRVKPLDMYSGLSGNSSTWVFNDGGYKEGGGSESSPGTCIVGSQVSLTGV